MSIEKFIKKIVKQLPGKVFTDREDIFCYGFDASSTEGTPAAVLRPSNTDDVSIIASLASETGTPLVPRGAGTGMTGGAVPIEGTVVLSFEGMNRILDIDHKNMIAAVEPGVINSYLQEKLEEKNLFYPPDPASMKFCTLGGNIAENAGGPRAVKYGVTRDYVLGLEVVLADGRVLNTGGITYKGVVGYDLTSLMVGSEGTLGIVTKIFLKVLPTPEQTATLLCTFSSLDEAGEAIAGITASAIIPRTLELMDHQSIAAVENYRKFGLPLDAEALLLIEVDGAHPVVSRDAEHIASICSSFNGRVSVADDIFSKQKLWEARRIISPALYYLKPAKINEDIVVPRGRIAAMLRELRNISDRYGLLIANFGHAGDGNIHVNIMTDKNDVEEYKKAHEALNDIFRSTLDMGGTISGEHGVGLTKKPYIGMEVSKTGLDIMRSIKDIFDPGRILNPGKMFPDD